MLQEAGTLNFSKKSLLKFYILTNNRNLQLCIFANNSVLSLFILANYVSLQKIIMKIV